jgi:hypothetical protein
MIDVDKVLEDAARETREKASGLRPPDQRWRRPVMLSRGWQVMATAFAIVVILVGLPPLLGRRGSGGSPGRAPVTSISTVTTAVTDSSSPEVRCSASGMSLPGPETGLPLAVAQTRETLAEAAIACDWDTMSGLVAEQFTTTFGGGDFSLLRQWEDQGYERLRIAVALLGMPYTVQHIDGQADIYVWPSAFGYDTWDEIPESDLEPLTEIYTEDELDQIASFGSYAGWRLGISEEGQWRFFVAGD